MCPVGTALYSGVNGSSLESGNQVSCFYFTSYFQRPFKQTPVPALQSFTSVGGLVSFFRGRGKLKGCEGGNLPTFGINSWLLVISFQDTKCLPGVTLSKAPSNSTENLMLALPGVKPNPYSTSGNKLQTGAVSCVRSSKFLQVF